MADPRPRLGISSCLLGEEVRYDGGHMRAKYLCDVLQPFVEWVSVCPELELGMGVPREPVELRDTPHGLRMLGRESGRDWSDAFRSWSSERAGALPALDGYVFKARSPSCGLAGARPAGLWAARLEQARPLMARIEGEALAGDLRQRERFLTRAFVSARLRAASGRDTAGRLHERLRLLLAGHAPGAWEAAGAALDEGVEAWREAVAAALGKDESDPWQLELLEQLRERAAVDLDPPRAAALAGAIAAFAEGSAPLERARSILRAWARRHDPHGVGQQLWLEPFPRTLALLVVS